MSAGGAPAVRYPGGELELFERATRWKAYLGRQLAPFLEGDVLEVGAGRGGTTPFLWNARVASWCCLEPDPALCREIERKIAGGRLPGGCRAEAGGVAGLAAERRFDAVVYVDVLEHVEDDRSELASAARRLREGGHLVVLGPAHPWLYSPFDAAIGHFRRYSQASLRALAPPGLVEVAGGYLDSAGLLASAGNRLLLRSADPSPAQIGFWDRWLVPVSERLDRLLGGRVGKSVFVVWQRPGTP
ncbi:MAG: class I SAM-dependent methyltransferase [Myxococcota bacterium]